MALLQIAEPGRAAAPHQHRLAVGIDLGTTNSLVATVRSASAHGAARRTGRLLLPSVVHYAETGECSGRHGARLALADRCNTIASAKRLIGRALADVAAAAVPYALEPLSDSAVGVRTRHGLKSPVDDRPPKCCACCASAPRPRWAVSWWAR
jgi:molecular chaperone HscA